MRIVRFYLEPWQKGGTPSPSPSILILSPRIKRRQRIPKCDLDKTPKSTLSEREIRFRRLSRSGPQAVKRLSAICIDFIAKNVRYCHSLVLFLNHSLNHLPTCQTINDDGYLSFGC